MRAIEIIDETAISWETGSEFDQSFEAALRAAAAGTVDVIDETAVTWRTGSAFDRSFESAVTVALKPERLGRVPSGVVG